MFSFFNTKSKRPDFQDKVWKTKAIAWKQLATEALRILTANEIPVVVLFFSEAHQEFDTYLASLTVPFARMGEGYAPAESNPVVFTADAFALAAHGVPAFISTQPSTKVHFLFVGHYPLPAREDTVLEKLAHLKASTFTVSFWISLEDKLMKMFGSENIVPLLEKLGLRDDECIEHGFVSKALANAQRKIGAAVKYEKPAANEEEWFSVNMNKT